MIKKVASAILIPAVVVLLVVASIAYSEPAQAAETSAVAAATEVSAQQRRPRTRITVTPRRYLAYPGPNAVRQCTSWLQPENRPSGSVITPQMRCWWVRG